ncbi:PqqD family protein [Candidatus Ruminimicrobium bovinum]|uniref:PqqD family protein n=1 Tax=Candidatus Ruminimicrobium bovinum TaxID=3242779 RepID=UPI0039B96FE9
MYKLNEAKMFADITDNVAIIINSETGIYYAMNNCGSIIFKDVIDGCSTNLIIDNLKKIESCPNDIEQKFKIFIDELLKKEIIIAGEKSSKTPVLDEAIIKKDKFEMKVSEYEDAQEMLLADPIHDVDEEEGWQPVFKEEK